MTRLFIPGCNNRLICARSAKRLEACLLERGIGGDMTGCCKTSGPKHNALDEKAKLVVMCNT